MHGLFLGATLAQLSNLKEQVASGWQGAGGAGLVVLWPANNATPGSSWPGTSAASLIGSCPRLEPCHVVFVCVSQSPSLNATLLIYRHHSSSGPLHSEEAQPIGAGHDVDRAARGDHGVDHWLEQKKNILAQLTPLFRPSFPVGNTLKLWMGNNPETAVWCSARFLQPTRPPVRYNL